MWRVVGVGSILKRRGGKVEITRDIYICVCVCVCVGIDLHGVVYQLLHHVFGYQIK